MNTRLSSEQYLIDENNCITIPYSVIYNAGLGSDKELNVMEKSNTENVYCITPDEKCKGYEFVQKVTCTKEDGMKIDVTGMFELKPGDSVSVDVYEFKLFMFDRVSVIKNNEEEKETKKETGSMKNLFDCFGIDPYADLIDDSLELLKENLDKDMKRLDKVRKDKKLNKGVDFNNLLDNTKDWKKDPPSLEELDNFLGNLLKDIVSKSNKQLHRSKDPLLNEFIDDMLARVYGQGGQKVVMISSSELDQFVKDMTWWYNRIKKGE